MWKFGHSDTYGSVGYDTLHSDDVGKIGHHLWPLVRDIVAKIDELLFKENMGAFPHWPTLERFDPSKKPLNKIEFSDGNTFLSIMKVRGGSQML